MRSKVPYLAALAAVTLLGLVMSCEEDPQGPGSGMTVTLATPPAGGAEADSTFVIEWTSTNAAGNASVALYYDTDMNPNLKEPIVAGQAASGNYTWDCAQVPEGTYYIYAVISGGGQTADTYSPGTVTLTHPWATPSITVLTPPAGGATADSTYTITWQTSNFDSADVELAYSLDTLPENAVLIAGHLEDTGSFVWDCSRIDIGEYYIYAKAVEIEGGHHRSGAGALASIGGTDGPKVEAYDWSDSTLTIEHGGGEPEIRVTQPPAEGSVADSLFMIEWVSIASAGATVDLYYDTDTMPGSGLEQIAAQVPDTSAYLWDCSRIDQGDYYIFARIFDGDGPLTGLLRAQDEDYSDGILSIVHGSGRFEITMPPAGGVEADSAFVVEWVSDQPTSETVDLWYSADTTGSELFTMVEDAPNEGNYRWDCLSVPEGDWWVYGAIELASDTLTDWSAGPVILTHTGYAIEVTAPPAGGATADTSYTIEWTATGPDSGVVDLAYDDDLEPSFMRPIAEGLDNTGSYDWDCSAVPEGSYYIYATIHDPSDGSVLWAGYAWDYSDGLLTIQHETTYDLRITMPPEEGAQADSLFLVEWVTDAPGSMTLDLYYSADTSGTELFPIENGAPNTGSYLWDTSVVPEGDWYVYGALNEADATTDWSAGQLTVTHFEYTMEVTAPPAGGASADSTYTVEWTATGPAGAVVDLFYDVDTDPTTMSLIRENVPNGGSFTWNTMGVAEGEYYVYAIIHPPGTDPTDAGWRTAADYSDGTLTIDHADYYVMVTAPPEWGAQADDEYTIQWAAVAPSGTTVDLYTDDDTEPGSGLEAIELAVPWDDYQYVWDCHGVEEGAYYIYAEMHSPHLDETWTDYSDSTLVIDHDPLYLFITEPPAVGASADSIFLVEWLSDGPISRTIDLYYDTDTIPDSGLELIVADEPSGHQTSTYRWDCSAVPEGEYYVYGMLRDGFTREDTVTHYSRGTLDIQH